MSEATGLPNGWCRTTLGALGTFINGDRGKNYPSKSAFVESGVPFINAGHLINGLIDLSEMNYITSQRFDILGSGKVQSNDLLYCIRGSLGKAAMVTSIEQGAIASSLVIIRPARTLIHRYLYYFLVSPLGNEQISKYDNGSAKPNLSAANVKLYSIPFAPLNEQRRIVAKIDELFSDLDAGVATLERVRANLKRYRATVLKAAVEGKLTEDWRAQHPDTEPASVLLERILTERRRQWEKDQLAKFAHAGKPALKGWLEKYRDPEKLAVQPDGELPHGWCWATWEQLSARVTVGHVGPMKHEYVDEGVPFLRSQNIRENRFDKEGLLHIAPRFHNQLAKSVVRPGDLAVVRSGSVGVTCVIPNWLGEANCSDLVLIQQPNGVLAEYGAFYMNSAARRLVKAGTVGIALTHFNTRSVASLPVPLPPLEEQEEIVNEVCGRLSILDEIEAQVDANLKRASRLRQGILKRAFEGRLVAQDPTDEPAEKLLERIRLSHRTQTHAKSYGGG